MNRRWTKNASRQELPELFKDVPFPKQVMEAFSKTFEHSYRWGELVCGIVLCVAPENTSDVSIRWVSNYTYDAHLIASWGPAACPFSCMHFPHPGVNPVRRQAEQNGRRPRAPLLTGRSLRPVIWQWRSHAFASSLILAVKAAWAQWRSAGLVKDAAALGAAASQQHLLKQLNESRGSFEPGALVSRTLADFRLV